MNTINLAGLDTLFDRVTQVYQTAQGMQASAAILLVVGLLSCFLGFRLTRFVSALAGALVGSILCAFVAMSYLPDTIGEIGAIAAAIVGALLVGYLFYHLYYVMIFLTCAAAGAAIGSVPAMAAGLGSPESGTTVFYVIVLVCALLFGAAGVLFLKPVVIVLTSFGGFLAAMQLPTFGVALNSRMTLVAGAALTVAGLVVQFATCRKRGKPGFRKIKSAAGSEPTLTENGETIQYQDIDETPEPPRMAADELYDSLSQNGFMKFLMAISPVLAIASAVALPVLGLVHYELVLIFAFLCYAGRKRKSLVVTFLLLLLYSAFRLISGLPTANWQTTEGIISLAFDGAACALFLLLFLLALVSERRAHPKKKIRRVPVTEPDEQATAPIDNLEETRPLTAEEVDEAFSETAEVEATRPLAADDVEATRPLSADDTRAFEPMAPEEFRQTQEEVFGEETVPVADSMEEDGMEEEPDAAENLDETRRM